MKVIKDLFSSEEMGIINEALKDKRHGITGIRRAELVRGKDLEATVISRIRLALQLSCYMKMIDFAQKGLDEDYETAMCIQAVNDKILLAGVLDCLQANPNSIQKEILGWLIPWA